MRSLVGFLCVLSLATPARAQEREIEAAGLPREVADRLLGIVHDPQTIRLDADTHVPADSSLRGNVLVMGGLRLAGRVDGELIVVHGNVDLETGAEVRGDLTVVGGEVRGAELGRIGGTLTAYGQGFRYVQRGERGRYVPSERRVPASVSGDLGWGASSQFAVRGGNYNRVEGLPIMVGPVLRTGGRNPFRVETLVIWRTESDIPFANDQIGYQVQVEQFLANRRSLRVGAGIRSIVDPIQPAGLTDRENSWSTFLFTSDQRDYFERQGWRVFARATPRALPVDATVEFWREIHGVLGPADPWSIFRSSRDWRAQPLVAEGSSRSFGAHLTMDTRDDRSEPLQGWHIQAHWQQRLGGSLQMPLVARPELPDEPPPLPLVAPDIDARFTTASLDIRRYNPIGNGARLNLRGVIGGSPRGEILPPQHQHALGGIGSLPGHSRFAADCGARTAQVRLVQGEDERLMFPFYGCDRFALFQAEYRGPLNLRFGFGPPGEPGRTRGRSSNRPGWAIFFDAGRAWSNGDWGELSRPDSPVLYDAGLGLLFGGGGVYWAVPLGEDVGRSRFFARLDRRF